MDIVKVEEASCQDFNDGGSKDKHVESESVAYDGRFVWNEYIVQSLLDLRSKLDPNERDEMDRCQFIVCFPNPSLCIA